MNSKNEEFPIDLKEREEHLKEKLEEYYKYNGIDQALYSLTMNLLSYTGGTLTANSIDFYSEIYNGYYGVKLGEVGLKPYKRLDYDDLIPIPLGYFIEILRETQIDVMEETRENIPHQYLTEKEERMVEQILKLSYRFPNIAYIAMERDLEREYWEDDNYFKQWATIFYISSERGTILIKMREDGLFYELIDYDDREVSPEEIREIIDDIYFTLFHKSTALR